MTVPFFYNPESGSSQQSLEKILDDERIDVQPVDPAELGKKLGELVNQGVERVVVSGGDGTIALAASKLAGSKSVLGVVPSGTLNHFAGRTGIPVDSCEALENALHGRGQPVDVGYVNGNLFINTSSVGAYPLFVRSREKLENRMSYLPASIVAGFRRLWRFRKIHVRVLGQELHTPLVFVGVMERELSLPSLGGIKKGGQPGLHLIAVDSRSRLELLRLLATVFFLGADPFAKQVALQNEMVDEVALGFRQAKRRIQAALDGELVWLHSPLRYSFGSGDLLVALPETG